MIWHPSAEGAARALLVAAVLAAPGAAELLVNRSLETLRLLGAATAAQRGLVPGLGLAGSVDQGLWLASGRRLYEVREGKWVDPGPGAGLADISLFGGDLVATRGSELVVLDRGRWALLAELPHQAMRLRTRADGQALLLYGGRGGAGEVYELRLDGTYQKVVAVDAPVTGVAELAGELLVSAGPEVFHLTAARRTTLFHRHPEPVLSMVADPRLGTTYLASPQGVYVLSAEGPLPLLVGTTGMLHHDGTYLLVMDPATRQVVALRARAHAAPVPAAERVLGAGVPVKAGAARGDGLELRR